MVSDEKINLLAKVASVPQGAPVNAEGVTEHSILTLAAASYGAKPTDDSTIPTGFDPFAAALFEGIVEGAYLVATADGVFDAEERAVFERIVTAACGGMVPPKLVSDLVADLADQLEEDGLERRIKRLGQNITRPEQALEILRIATLIALASDDISEVERDVLGKISETFDLGAGKVDEAIAAVRQALG